MAMRKSWPSKPSQVTPLSTGLNDALTKAKQKGLNPSGVGIDPNMGLYATPMLLRWRLF